MEKWRGGGVEGWKGAGVQGRGVTISCWGNSPLLFGNTTYPLQEELTAAGWAGGQLNLIPVRRVKDQTVEILCRASPKGRK